MQINEILEKTGQTEAMILREHAILTILTKLSRYDSECMQFEKKYGTSFLISNRHLLVFPVILVIFFLVSTFLT